MAKIALLLSGLSRQWSHCVQSQLKLFKNHKTDVFFHFWDTTDAGEKRDILTAYRPKAHIFEQPIDFTASEKHFTRLDNINSPSRMLSMYYSWKQVAWLFHRYRQESGVGYDFAVRLRADLMFFDSLDGFLPLLLANDLLLSNYNDFRLVNDMFALGGVNPIHYYLSLFDNLMTYKDHMRFNPEVLLDHHLRSNSLRIRVISTKLIMLVFRPHMIGKSIEECLKEHPGVNKWRDPEIVSSHRDYHGRKDGERGLQKVERFKNGT